jgi:hypothetical protein
MYGSAWASRRACVSLSDSVMGHPAGIDRGVLSQVFDRWNNDDAISFEAVHRCFHSAGNL